MKFRIDRFEIVVLLVIFLISSFAGAVSSQTTSYDDPALILSSQDERNGRNYNPEQILVSYLTEGFESWFPVGWSSDTTLVNYTWRQVTNYHHEGTHSADLYANPFYPQDEWLVTPTLDFSNAGADLSLSFWFLTSYYWMVYPNDNADLEILVSTDNGSNWSLPLWTEDDYGAFSNWSWHRQSLPMLNYVGESTVKIAFRYVGSNGAEFALDQISVIDSSLRLEHDSGTFEFVSPGGSGPAGNPITPEVTFRNFGNNNESFSVSLTIALDGSNVYSETDSISGLAPGASSTITFPSYTPATGGIYTLAAAAMLVGDQNSANDSLSFEYNAVTTDIGDESEALPSEFGLEQNYPNPFNAQTTIRYNLPVASKVMIGVFDLLGRKIAVLVDENQQAGGHQIIWNAADIPSGMYFYKIETDGFAGSKNMLLLK